MGAVALARQFFHDSQWYGKVWQAYRSDSTQPRPAINDSLEVMQQLGNKLCVINTSNELYFLRADRFAREFGLNLVVHGSGNEYRRLQAVRRSGRAVIVPVAFPKPPNVGTVETARNVKLEDLMHWHLAPKNPAALERAGVRFALTSHGLDDREEFLTSVKKAVERGLTPAGALSAVTTVPAELLGASRIVGTIDRGKLANLVVVDGDIFGKETEVLETWVAGKRFQIKSAPAFDLRGDWRLAASDGKQLVLTLSGEPASLKGTLTGSGVKGDDPIKLSHTGLRDARFSCTFPAENLGHDGVARLSAVVSDKGGAPLGWIGGITWPDGSETTLTATYQGAENESQNTASQEIKEKEDEQSPLSIAINYPLGASGREAAPDQPRLVLIKNATIWTCDERGVLENGSVLFGDGKILDVGTDIVPPDDALVIDAAGKHVTPGIIDCHSHMATDGGVNESTQAITSEVRIGDFIDSDDISIYRQLAGGVTTSNILHGSANPIGGQNQVIKLRWSHLPEELKFAEAPAGIKFALGENVKQSNWGDEYTTRYPQTRMGVEQIMRDAFHAARFYQLRWRQWNDEHRGLPPRRDLELEALSEILEGKRWIHCHSYRQDEILALIRTLKEFGIQIGTFQHILEGYKVADEMADHGAMGSAFSDWWAYKFEVYDAIPYAGSLMHQAGVVVSFNSDDRELARHLNQEAAKAVKYGGVEPAAALQFVTLNPARQLRIDDYVGSIKAGKHADLVVWSGPPLSNFSVCQQTWIDGRIYFDIEEDRETRIRDARIRRELVQRILDSKELMKSDDEDESSDDLWPRDDIFCKCRRDAAR